MQLSVAAILLVASATVVDAGTPAQPKALLEVECVPSCNVLVDGQLVGKARFPFFTNIEVAPGKHRFTCEALMTKKRTPEQEFSVAPGETKVVRVRIQ